MIGRFIAAGIALLSTVLPALAHRLDEYAQVVAISVSRDKVTIDLRLTPGQLVADAVLGVIDIDADGQISPAEQEAYLTLVVGDLTITIDGVALLPVVESFAYPDEQSVRDGVGIISITLSAAVHGAGDHKLGFLNRHMPEAAVYLVNALVPNDVSIVVGEQTRTSDQAAYELRWITAEAY